LRLPAFEGPLDVLLRLIEREQLPINEVSLLSVLDQFLAFMRGLHAPAPDVVADFAAVAGRLSVLKSRALLPRPPQAAEEPADPDDLVRQLEEYRALKMAAGLLAVKQQGDVGAFARGDAVAAPAPATIQLAPLEPVALAKAMHRWLSRVPRPSATLSALRVTSLREMIHRITGALARERSVTFEAVRASCVGRQEVAVAFLAVLVLLRRQAIVAAQSDTFGSIRLSPAPDPLRRARSVDELDVKVGDGRD
jgi:segregation and condensation protein A